MEKLVCVHGVLGNGWEDSLTEQCEKGCISFFVSLSSGKQPMFPFQKCLKN